MSALADEIKAALREVLREELPRTELGRLAAEIESLRRQLPPSLVTMTHAAKVLGVSLSTVRRKVRDGSLPSRKIGRAVRVDLAALRPMTPDDVDAEVRRLRTVPN